MCTIFSFRHHQNLHGGGLPVMFQQALCRLGARARTAVTAPTLVAMLVAAVWDRAPDRASHCSCVGSGQWTVAQVLRSTGGGGGRGPHTGARLAATRLAA